MQGSLDSPPIIVRGSRARGAWLLCAASVFVALDAMVLLGPRQGDGGAAFGAVFFGLCAAAGLWMVIAPARLEIGPSGITQKVLWRTARYAWSDVYDFRPTVLGLRTKTVGFSYLVERPKRAWVRNLNAAIAGVQGVLQSGWSLEPRALADLLNQARERWLGAAAGAPALDPGAIEAPPLLAGFAGARMNRKVYAMAAGLVFALAIALSSFTAAGRGGTSVFSLFLARFYAARLHDIGRSGWWQVVLYAVQVAVIVSLMAAGQPGRLAIGAAVVIQFVFTAVLGAIPGQPGPNRFGPAPGQLSPAAQSEVFR